MPRSEPIKSVRGVRDILPADLPLWRAAQQAGRTVAESFGYAEIETPVIDLEELIERVGEDEDRVATAHYRFDERGRVNVAPRPALNTIGDCKCRPAYLERLKEYYRPLKSQLHGDCQLRLERNPLRLLDCKVPQCQPFKAGAPKIIDHLCQECGEHWAEVRRL